MTDKAGRETGVPAKVRGTESSARAAVVGIVASIEGLPAENRFRPRIVAAVENTVATAGGRSVFLDRRSDLARYARLEAVADDLSAAGVQGVVLIEQIPEDDAGAARLFPRRRIPTVWITPRPSLMPVPTVYYDNDHAGYLAALHLIETGCRTLLFPHPADIFTESRYRDIFSYLIERLSGAERACLRNGGRLMPLSLPTTDHHTESKNQTGWAGMGVAAVEAIVGALSQVDGRVGIIAPNDRFAHSLRGALAARRAPLLAPDDYALIGFDNLPEDAEAGLTSLEPPIESLGQRAADLILDRIALTASSDTITDSLSQEAIAAEKPRSIRIRSTLHPRITTRR